jgi:hypothetical protein
MTPIESNDVHTYLAEIVAAVRAGDEEGQRVDESHAGILGLCRGRFGVKFGEAVEGPPSVRAKDLGDECMNE